MTLVQKSFTFKPFSDVHAPKETISKIKFTEADY